ncbi:11944_t:CDS:2, partial [Dentiscutata erythropus]
MNDKENKAENRKQSGLSSDILYRHGFLSIFGSDNYEVPAATAYFIYELTKFRRLWWDQGNLHPKANWERLPYELISNVSWENNKAEGMGKEADGCLQPIKKQQVASDGCDGLNEPWPNLVVEIAYLESVDHLFNKIKNYWLLSNRVHDAITIKLEPPNVPKKIPSRMTSWHFCVDQKVEGELDPEVHEFGTVDQFGNCLNIQPGQYIIKIKLECIYAGIVSEFDLPIFLPNPITIDLFRVQKDIL